MDAKGSFAEGGVKISHRMLEGAHYYKVDVVSIRTHSGGGPAFARKGDTLTSINGTNLASVTPEELTRLLTNGNPKLTVHQTALQTRPPRVCPPGEDAFLPFKKESALLCFSMEMRREEDLGQGGSGEEHGGEEGEGEGMCTAQQEHGGEEGEGEGEGMCTAQQENGGEEGEGEGMCTAQQEHGGEEGEGHGLLVVKLTNLSISVVRGRGLEGCSGLSCQDGCSDPSCCGAACTLNEVVLLANESTVTQGNTGSFVQLKANQGVSVENIGSNRYLRSLCMEDRLYTSNEPEKMTIYHYKSNTVEEHFRGMPVVLNFTHSQSFLMCCKKNDQAVLQVKAWDKERLKLIRGQDESALAFLFYMKGNSSDERKFESVLCPGWFIRVLNQDTVQIDSCKEDPSFYFVIQP